MRGTETISQSTGAAAMVPEIAIIGHPNEGKSSVLSTLAEDDSVRISPFPGETTRCRTFPVSIDGREALRFTDTPGFQNPALMLSLLQQVTGTGSQRLQALLAATAQRPDLREDHELLQPIARGAGIIYVVDGSRPVRKVDRIEMDLLRLINRPRMAVINCKDEAGDYLAQWKDELGKHFNAWRLFNAHRATYAERIDLLEAMKAIDPDWQPTLARVVESFRQDWQARARTTAAIICELLTECLALRLEARIVEGTDEHELTGRLAKNYSETMAKRERAAHLRIRSLFKHNIFNAELPPHSVMHEELFSRRTWQLLGLSGKQIALIGGLSGAALGATIDVAALGHSLGLFTALGGLAGALSAGLGKDRLSTEASLFGIRVAGPKLEIGPTEHVSLLFVLLNRALLYYRYIINWAHGRRDYTNLPADRDAADPAFTRSWPPRDLKVCQHFFKSASQPGSEQHRANAESLQAIIVTHLMAISEDR